MLTTQRAVVSGAMRSLKLVLKVYVLNQKNLPSSTIPGTILPKSCPTQGNTTDRYSHRWHLVTWLRSSSFCPGPAPTSPILAMKGQMANIQTSEALNTS